MFELGLSFGANNAAQKSTSLLMGDNTVFLKDNKDLSDLSGATVLIEGCFSWNEDYTGSFGELYTSVDGVNVYSGTICKYGRTKFQFVLKNFNPKAALKFGIDVHQLALGDTVSINEASSQIGGLELFCVGALENEVGLRSHIAKATSETATELGLRVVYMKDEKTARFKNRILNSLSEGVPFSVIRVGDGEGRVIGFPDHFSEQEILTQVLYYHFGPESMNRFRSQYPKDWISRATLDLKEKITNSICSADGVGLPVYDFFRAFDSGATSGMVGYGAAMFYCLSKRPHANTEDLVGTNVFQQLAIRDDFFPEVIASASKLTTIGPWNLIDKFQELWGLTNVEHIEVPRHYTWSKESGLGQYPELYRVVEKKIAELGDVRGQLFLVGAGLLGKHYCHLVKMQGGVALDIGSVFDSWAGQGLPYAIRNSAINLEKFSSD